MMPQQRQPEDTSDKDVHKQKHPRIMSRVADAFILIGSVFYALAAVAMTTVSLGLIYVSFTRVYAALTAPDTRENILLDAVSSLVISVAILDVAKYVMEEEVLRSRELRRPHEAREAVTKFMVIIALVVSIEGIVLVFEHGRDDPEALLYPVLLLFVSVVIVVGLGVFQRFSLKSEEHLDRGRKDDGPD
ncbi:hypothetical protein [Yoonia sp.]|uniref:hypothetical protein n=1 Tax=Yoonia sp. TaxID=2212373 RepID=UPI003F6C5286